jgi:hypothetical protein
MESTGLVGAGFNRAPPSVLVDTMGSESAVRLIDEAGLGVPRLSRAPRAPASRSGSSAIDRSTPASSSSPAERRGEHDSEA